MDYQLVLYDNDNVILAVTKPITNVTVTGNSVAWDSGRSEGIQTNFIVVPIDQPVGDVGEILSQEAIDNDKKSVLLSKEAELQGQIKTINDVLDFLLGL